MLILLGLNQQNIIADQKNRKRMKQENHGLVGCAACKAGLGKMLSFIRHSYLTPPPLKLSPTLTRLLNFVKTSQNLLC